MKKITKAKSLGRRVGITKHREALAWQFVVVGRKTDNVQRRYIGFIQLLLCARAVLRSSMDLNSFSPHNHPRRQVLQKKKKLSHGVGNLPQVP